MGRRQRRVLERKAYTCQLAPYVTDWGGSVLHERARVEVDVRDVVRIVFRLNEQSFARYVCIDRIVGKTLYGTVDDPYNGYVRGGCDLCGEAFRWHDKMYVCEHDDCWNYHECEACFRRSTHRHTRKPHPFRNGTTMRFRRTHISEIPDWTPNTARIIRQYKDPSNARMPLTGVVVC